MPWDPVQVRTYEFTGVTDVSMTLLDPPTPGSLLIAGYVTSNAVGAASDGWTKPPDGGVADFVEADGLFRVAGPGDDGAIHRTLSVADHTVGVIAEIAGTTFGQDAVLDKNGFSKPSANGTSSIAIGPVPASGALALPNDLAVAIFGVSRSLSGGTATFTGFSDGFALLTDGTHAAQIGATGGDAPLIAVAIRDTGAGVDPVSVTATLSAQENRPIALMMVFKGPPPVDVRAFLSGGPSNADPLLSIGGAQSSHEAPGSLFGGLSRLAADDGVDEYRLIYVENVDDTEAAQVKLFFDPLLDDDSSVVLGIAAQAAGAQVPAIADRFTDPGVSFSGPADEAGAVDAGVLGPGESRGVWMRRIAASGAADNAHNLWTLRALVAPL